MKALALYLRDPANVRIVLLTRDGRGVLWSHLKRVVPKKQAVTRWKKHYTRALPLLESKVRSDHLLRVKYESLTDAPKSELEKICAFIGLPFEPQMLDFRTKVHHTTNGNNIRVRGSSEIRTDSAWEVRLSPADLTYFEGRASRLNRRLGYR